HQRDARSPRRASPFLVEENPFADNFGPFVEHPIEEMDREVGHADVVARGEGYADRHPVRPFLQNGPLLAGKDPSSVQRWACLIRLFPQESRYVVTVVVEIDGRWSRSRFTYIVDLHVLLEVCRNALVLEDFVGSGL